ncbi:hypothetical protein EC900091_5011 [Escherichia coli 90.0091]|uniref:Uncharacterized protein n=1 Tax=Shigella dysenteriae 1617 TaxID=754093 RepID=A0A0A7A168_SHIDY|nr:hypothetical protein Asd1617_04814 [Shigella dysenteriae 1617]EHY12507.1 hypothetical protein ECDEC15D_3910 [Escherichia coli DEC15D]EKV87677.1 hypothetical protein EC900091_5011 [Escherichia coli 90.0091]
MNIIFLKMYALHFIPLKKVYLTHFPPLQYGAKIIFISF